MKMLTIHQGDAVTKLGELPSESVQCCVTSPPYWGLRDYSCDSQLGLEKTPKEYVSKMVEVFREVRRVLRKDGTLWLNIADTMLPDKNEADIPHRLRIALGDDGWVKRSTIIWHKPNPMPEAARDRPTKAHEYLFLLTKSANYFYDAEAIKETNTGRNKRTVWTVDDHQGLVQWLATNDSAALARFVAESRNKKDVWRIVTAPYPEAHFATYPTDLVKPCIMAGTSARGCCPKCGAPWERVVEQVGLSTYAKVKGERSWREMRDVAVSRGTTPSRPNSGQTRNESGSTPHLDAAPTKTIGWQPTCKCKISADTSMLLGDIVPCTVLDPFAGSGTTGQAALELGRKAILIELNPKYITLIEKRCSVTVGLPF
jgi:DNA modification methylase